MGIVGCQLEKKEGRVHFGADCALSGAEAGEDVRAEVDVRDNFDDRQIDRLPRREGQRMNREDHGRGGITP